MNGEAYEKAVATLRAEPDTFKDDGEEIWELGEDITVWHDGDGAGVRVRRWKLVGASWDATNQDG